MQAVTLTFLILWLLSLWLLMVERRRPAQSTLLRPLGIIHGLFLFVILSLAALLLLRLVLPD